MSANIKQRVLWIDLGKCLAIMAVTVDHMNGFFYDNNIAALLSTFSVGLFILLAGYSEYLSYQLHPKFSIQHYCKRILLMFCQYLFAVIITMCITQRSIDLTKLIDKIISFNIIPAYYYFAFFFQLMIIAPALERLCCKTNSFIRQAILVIGILLVSIMFSKVSVFYIYGGGGCILGGSFFFLYYLGMLMAKINLPEKLKKEGILLRIILLFVTIWWAYALVTGILHIDFLATQWVGGGFSPPGVIISTYALLVFFNVIMAGQRVSNYSWLRRLFALFSWIGQNTLPILLYHCFILWNLGGVNFWIHLLPDWFVKNSTLLHVLVWIFMLIIPSFCNTMSKKMLTSLCVRLKGPLNS